MKTAELKKIRPAPAKKPSNGKVVGMCLFLALAVLVVFGQTTHFEFINYDDEENVYQNPVVTRGCHGTPWAGRLLTRRRPTGFLTTLSHCWIARCSV